MRKSLTLSLPVHLDTIVEAVIATGHYHTKSEFFRTLLRDWINQQLQPNSTANVKRFGDQFSALIKEAIVKERKSFYN